MLSALALSALLAAPSSAPAPIPAARPAADVPVLELGQLLSVQDGRPELSPRVRELSGQRVRLRGWLVVFEEAPGDGFWLSPRPVFQDESGAGSGELPPSCVRVTAPAEVLAALPDDAVPLEVTGTLTTGRVADDAGRISIARIQVDGPAGVHRLERRPKSLPPSATDRPAGGANAAPTKEDHR